MTKYDEAIKEACDLYNKKEYKESFIRFQELAKMTSKNPIFAMILGGMHYMGMGCPKNEIESMKCYRYAAKKGWRSADKVVDVYIEQITNRLKISEEKNEEYQRNFEYYFLEEIDSQKSVKIAKICLWICFLASIISFSVVFFLHYEYSLSNLGFMLLETSDIYIIGQLIITATYFVGLRSLIVNSLWQRNLFVSILLISSMVAGYFINSCLNLIILSFALLICMTIVAAAFLNYLRNQIIIIKFQLLAGLIWGVGILVTITLSPLVSPLSMNAFGCAYYKGTRVFSQDYKMSFYWFQKAAVAGNTDGMNNLGNAFYNNEGTAKDYDMAFYWYQKAADAGNARGMSRLGDMYKNGKSVECDVNMAFYWYQKAADASDASGMVNLGHAYKDGSGTSQNDNLALYWYQRAADAGSIDGMINLGDAYYYGKITEQDYNMAIYWYQKGVDNGSKNGMNKLGNAYFAEQNYDMAIHWYQKADDAISSFGMRNVGFMYENGCGVSQDLNMAKQWYQKSLNAGYKDAATDLERLTSSD